MNTVISRMIKSAGVGALLFGFVAIGPAWGAGYPANQYTFQDAMDAFNYGDNDKAARILWPLANSGDAQAQYYLAYLMDSGQGLGRDVATAAGFYRKSADQDYLPAIVYMGYISSVGRGILKDEKEAFRWYTRGAQMGDAIAQNNLATMLRNGRPYAKNLPLAAQWFLQSAMQGNMRAQYNLATMYRLGEGIKQNLAEAVRWYTYAANQGDMYAQNALGYMYRKGEGVEKDNTAALDWYRRAAEQGHSPSEFLLAKMYEEAAAAAAAKKDDDGVQKNLEDAAIWYFHAAKGGSAKAQYRLGILYESGTGLPQDSREALRWYTDAAEKNNYTPAMTAIAAMYETGRKGISADMKKAITWYSRAATLGDGAAQFAMGRINMESEPKNLPKAYEWFSVASTSTDEEVKANAIVLRVKLSSMMKPEDVSAARLRASRFQPVKPLTADQVQGTTTSEQYAYDDAKDIPAKPPTK